MTERVVAISDLHGKLPPDGWVPECELLVLAGDLTWHRDPATERRWLTGPFADWLRRQPADEVVAIAGNHDWSAVYEPWVWRKELEWTYLEGHSFTSAGGLRVWGGPWTPQFGSWAFMAEEDILRGLWQSIPDDTQVLVTHGPPRGVLDLTHYGQDHAGSSSLLDRVRELEDLRLHVFGHIHEQRGRDETFSGRTEFANVSYVDVCYEEWGRAADLFEVEP